MFKRVVGFVLVMFFSFFMMPLPVFADVTLSVNTMSSGVVTVTVPDSAMVSDIKQSVYNYLKSIGDANAEDYNPSSSSTYMYYDNGSSVNSVDNSVSVSSLVSSNTIILSSTALAKSDTKVLNTSIDKNISSYLSLNSASNGAAFELQEGKSATINESAFIKNSAGFGGAVYNSGTIGQTSIIDGQEVLTDGIDKAVFENNSAHKYGGGIYNANTGKIANIENSTFVGNFVKSADGTGGAIYNTTNATKK